jgi:hypothetical protein
MWIEVELSLVEIQELIKLLTSAKEPKLVDLRRLCEDNVEYLTEEEK